MATTPIKAPEVQTIDSILKTIQPAIDPLLANQREQMGLVEQRAAADAKGLEQGQINAFRGITNQAQAGGNTFSGIPIGEQARYTGEHFLPAMANLKINAQNENIRIRDIMAQIQKDSYMQAFQTNQKQQDNQFTYSRDEAGRYYGTSEREAGQVYNTGEREAGQVYNTSEREEGQVYNTSERVAGQKYDTSERVAGQNYDWKVLMETQKFTSAENQKGIDAQMALARMGGGSRGGGGSAGDTTASAISNMAFDIANHADITRATSDGYLSPEAYNSFKSQWQGAGLDVRTFNDQFGYVSNPSHSWDYGLGDSGNARQEKTIAPIPGSGAGSVGAPSAAPAPAAKVNLGGWDPTTSFWGN